MRNDDRYMPISVSLVGRPCLVIGGNLAALREVECLLEYGAATTVVAQEVDAKLEFHARRGEIELQRRAYRPPEASGYMLVVSATGDLAVDRQICEDASKNNVLVNVIGEPEKSSFIFPAVMRRDCLTAAIATDGKAPFVSGHLQVVLENIFPVHWERLMKLASSFRTRVEKRWREDSGRRSACYGEFLEADWKTMLSEFNDEQIEKELTRILEMTG